MTGFNPRRVDIVKRNTRKLSLRSAPNYFFLEVSGRIGTDVPGCVRASEVPADLEKKLTAAWDGTDIFTEPPSEMGKWALFCSERVFRLAQSEKWTNSGFQPLHLFAPFHKRYMRHELELPLAELAERYTANLK